VRFAERKRYEIIVFVQLTHDLDALAINFIPTARQKVLNLFWRASGTAYFSFHKSQAFKFLARCCGDREHLIGGRKDFGTVLEFLSSKNPARRQC